MKMLVNDNDGSSEDEAQAAITAGNATYYNNPFPSRLRSRNTERLKKCTHS